MTHAVPVFSLGVGRWREQDGLILLHVHYTLSAQLNLYTYTQREKSCVSFSEGHSELHTELLDVLDTR